MKGLNKKNMNEQEIASVGFGYALRPLGEEFLHGKFRKQVYYDDWFKLQKLVIQNSLEALNTSNTMFKKNEIVDLFSIIKDENKTNNFLDKLTFNCWVEGYESGDREKLGQMIRAGDISFDVGVEDLWFGVSYTLDKIKEEPYKTEYENIIKKEK